MTSLLNEEALRALVVAQVREVTARPEFVTQRSVQEHVGIPAREYLRLARDGAFPSTKERRLVLARTADVVAFFAGRMQVSNPPAPSTAKVIARGWRRVAS